MKKISEESKACLELLIHQIKDIYLSDETLPEVKLFKILEIVNLWVKANNLHPEQVETLTMEQARALFNP